MWDCMEITKKHRMIRSVIYDISTGYVYYIFIDSLHANGRHDRSLSK